MDLVGHIAPFHSTPIPTPLSKNHYSFSFFSSSEIGVKKDRLPPNRAVVYIPTVQWSTYGMYEMEF